ncbi:hypothetical protein PQX77_018769 [Marasmius sp. AFHP31]|nr:hypothetical protein PQX77_018769 [Marasmius sp. AFHP31]
MSAFGPQDHSPQDEVFSYMQARFVLLVFQHAAPLILIYDYFLTLDEEILYVWNKSCRNLATALFFIVRYLTFIPVGLIYHGYTSRSTPMEDCRAWDNAAVWESWLPFSDSALGVIVLIEIVLGLRTWALWDRNKKVGLCIALTAFVLLAIDFQAILLTDQTETGFGIEFYRQTRICPPRYDGMGGVFGSNALSTGLMLIVVYESVVLVLTLIQAYRHGCYRRRGSSSRFVDSFISQGVAYNCLILGKYRTTRAFPLKILNSDAPLVWSTTNIICRYKLPPGYEDILVVFQPTLHAVLVSRMLLHLRKETHRRGSSSGISSLSDLVAPNPNLSRSVRDPGSSCPQITCLDLGGPLSYGCEMPE